MKSQLNSQSELDEIFKPFSQQTADKGITLVWSGEDSITEAKAKLLQLALSCLIEKLEFTTPTEYGRGYDDGIKFAIDTIEQNIKLKFGGSDEHK